jgi:DNA-binding response OmpR family regulator
VLVVSEDATLLRLLQEALASVGLDVQCERNAARGLQAAIDGQHRLVLLDTATRLGDIRGVLRVGVAQRLSVDGVVDVGGIRVIPSARLVQLDGRALELTSIEYDLLEHLVREVGRVVARDELMSVVGRRDPSPFDRSVDVHISHLRRKLRVHARRIVTVRGVGYMLAARVADGQ